MQTNDFDYILPEQLIAQSPVEPRDSSRLMLVDRSSQSTSHYSFNQLGSILKPDDVLVMNDSRVIPARIYGVKSGTGGKIELLLLKRIDDHLWEAMTKPAKRLKPGTVIELGTLGLKARIIKELDEGIRVIEIEEEGRLFKEGQIPLPPYIHTPLGDSERYQTVYSCNTGSVAAPTSGLHFTPGLMQQLQHKGIEILYVTLHIGLDTFRPVKVDNPVDHHIHTEYGVILPEVATRLAQARNQKRRIISVGTSTARLLEYTAGMQSYTGWIDLFILPGYRFKLMDGLITNFHLPRSTLLMLVSAFAGHELIMEAYTQAIMEKYRFYSFGDAMLII